MTTERVLWREDRERFLRALDRLDRHRERRRAEMLILYDTGCRVSELAALDIDDYNPQRRTLWLTNSKAYRKPKREVPIHPRTVRALNAWLRKRPACDTKALFVSQEEHRLSIRTIQNDYDIVCGLANIDGQGIHTLRHTSATRILDDRILPVHQLSRRLGHTSTQTTYRYYVHGSVEEEAEAIQRSRM